MALGIHIVISKQAQLQVQVARFMNGSTTRV